MIYDTEVERTGEEDNSSDDYEEVTIVSGRNTEDVQSQNTN